MKKVLFFTFLMILSLSASNLSANSSPSVSESAKPDKTEKNLTNEELNHMKSRIDEIRKMDKSNLSSEEKMEVKKELKEMKEDIRRDGGYVYIGGGTLLLIIILIVLLA